VYGFIVLTTHGKLSEEEARDCVWFRGTHHISLYTILSLPILYGVWLQQGGSGGGSYIAQKSCDGIAVVCHANERG